MALARGQQQQQSGSSQQRGQQSGQQSGTVQGTAATALPTAILARVGNEAVNLIAFGDIPGHSPSYLCVDDAGVSNWVSMNEVQIIDAKVLPLTPDLMGRIQNQLQNIGR